LLLTSLAEQTQTTRTLSYLSEALSNIAQGQEFYLEDLPVDSKFVEGAKKKLGEILKQQPAFEITPPKPLTSVNEDSHKAFSELASFYMHSRVQSALHSQLPTHKVSVRVSFFVRVRFVLLCFALFCFALLISRKRNCFSRCLICSTASLQ
jgi:hypothetical protein